MHSDAVALKLAAFGRGSGEIVMNNVQCQGDEQKLVNCSHSPVHNCDHSEDASVSCKFL